MNDAKALKLIGELAAEHRLLLGYSQQNFAIRVGLRAQTIRFFEKGHRWPGEEVRRKIEQGLGWRPGSIIEFREQAQATPDTGALKTLHSIQPTSTDPPMSQGALSCGGVKFRERTGTP